MDELKELKDSIQRLNKAPTNYRLDLAVICLLQDVLKLRNIEISRLEFSMLINYDIAPKRFNAIDTNILKYKTLYFKLMTSKDIDTDLFWHYNDELKTYKCQTNPTIFLEEYLTNKSGNQQIINEIKTFKLVHQLIKEGYPIPVKVLSHFTSEEIEVAILSSCQQCINTESSSTAKNLSRERDRREQNYRVRESNYPPNQSIEIL